MRWRAQSDECKCITCVGSRERESEQEQTALMSQPFTHRHMLSATPTLYVIHQVWRWRWRTVEPCGGSTVSAMWPVGLPAIKRESASWRAKEQGGVCGWDGGGERGPQRMRSPIQCQTNQIMADSSGNHAANISHPLVKKPRCAAADYLCLWSRVENPPVCCPLYVAFISTYGLQNVLPSNIMWEWELWRLISSWLVSAIKLFARNSDFFCHF